MASDQKPDEQAARQARGPARSVPMRAAVLALATAFAAAQAQDPVGRLLYTDAAHHLAADDPEVRGEAALVLAASGDPRHYEAILAIAKEEEPAAQLRGIVALGYLGEPAARSLLESVLAESATRVRPRGVAAAFALGLLPDDRADAAVARQLVHFQEGSMKRQRDSLLGILTALAARGSSSQGAALRDLNNDVAIRDDGIRGALLLALAHVPGGIDAETVRGALAGGAQQRRTALAALAHGAEDPPTALLPDLAVCAVRDGDATVRAGALAVLTRARHLPALDIAARGVRAADPVEVEQATRTAIALGGAPMRRALERQLDTLTTVGKAAMLRAFQGPMSADFRDAVLRLAREPGTDRGLRLAAVLALAQADEPEATPLLPALFATTRSADDLRALAGALVRAGDPPSFAELARDPADLALDRDRLAALLLAGHPEASRFCVQQIQRRDLAPAAAAAVLRTVRTMRLPAIPPAVLALVPEPVQSLVR